MKLHELAAELDELQMKDRLWREIVIYLERHVDNEELTLRDDEGRVIPKEIIQLVINDCDAVADIGRQRIETIQRMEVSDGERRRPAITATDPDELRAAVSDSKPKQQHAGSKGKGVDAAAKRNRKRR
jgi:hypothetical protein